MPIIVSTTPPRFRLRRLAIVAAIVLSAAALAVPAPARAATLTVVGDVNAGSAGNLRLYENVLAGGRSVLFARGFGQISEVAGHYRLMGATTVAHATAITPAVLDTTDLLVLTASYNSFLSFTLSELGAVRDYGLTGGRILMVTEAAMTPVLNSYNAVLEGIGASIRFTGSRFAEVEIVENLPDTPITAGLLSFRVSPYNTLSGGTAAVTPANGVAVAFETLGAPVPVPVPLPGAGPMTAFGLGLLLMARRLRRGPETGAKLLDPLVPSHA